MLEAAPLRDGRRRYAAHTLVKAWQPDAAALVAQVSQNLRQNMDRICRGTAIARVEIDLRPHDGHLLADAAAQPRGYGRGAMVPHRRIADEDDVGGKLVAVPAEKGVEMAAVGLLIAFDENRQPAGEFFPHF